MQPKSRDIRLTLRRIPNRIIYGNYVHSSAITVSPLFTLWAYAYLEKLNCRTFQVTRKIFNARILEVTYSRSTRIWPRLQDRDLTLHNEMTKEIGLWAVSRLSS